MARRWESLVYAVGFTLALPAALVGWAAASPMGQGLPLPSAALGLPLALAGGALWLWAVAAFVRRTGKLPLNADPPAEAITAGPYAWLDDPIYVGFGMLACGAAIAAASPAGVWLVAPVVTLSMAALVAGYEAHHRPVRPVPARLRWPASERRALRDLLNGALAAGAVGAVLFAGRSWPGPAAAGVIGAGLVLFALSAARLHAAAVRLATAVANSWSAVRIGPARVISYAPMAAVAAGVGALVFATAARDTSGAVTGTLAACVLLGGGLWGASLESTGRLARPFGYFGAFLGGVVGVGLVALVFRQPWLSIGAALALAAPWIQAVGRLRCLVQGCCFGRPIPHGEGIVYRRAESRAVALGGLGGRALYPTPVFSIYANLLSGALTLRLYLAGQDASAILAAYLLLAGLSRFAEEGFRGEADVRRHRGLTIYQWLALGQLLAGIGFSLLGSPALPPPQAPTAGELLAVVGAALAFGLAMGVDFPDLDAPLARLTPTPRSAGEDHGLGDGDAGAPRPAVEGGLAAPDGLVLDDGPGPERQP